MSNSFSDSNFDPSVPPLSRSAPRSGGGFKIVVLLLIAGGVCLLLCCGGGVGLGIFFMEVIATEIEQKVRDHPQVREHVGEIQELSMDFTKSVAHENDDVYIYNVKGTAGEGELIVEQYTDDNGDEVITAAQLRLPDGTTIEIDMDLIE